MGYIQGVPDIVVGDEDPDAGLREPAHDALDLVHGDRVDSGEGFVQKQEFRVEGERAGDLGASALAPG